MALTKEEKRDLAAAGWQEGQQAAQYTDVANWDFREVGVPGETEDDLYKLDYDQAVEVLSMSAWESEANSRQYSGHPTYEISRIFGARDRDEWDLEAAYEIYEEGVSKGIARGVAKRLGPESGWGKRTKGELGQIRPYGPGKFNTILDGYIYESTLDGGADEEASYGDGGGWYGLVRFGPHDVAHFQAIAQEHGDRLTPDEVKGLRTHLGVILFERSDGLVDSYWFDSKKKLDEAWKSVEEDVYGAGDENEDWD